MSRSFSYSRRKYVSSGACPGYLIAIILKISQEIRFVGLNQVGQSSVASGMRIPTGHHINPGWTADWMIDVK